MNNFKSNPLKTILVISCGFLVIYIFTDHNFALYISLIISTLGIVSSRLSNYIEIIWFKIATILSFIIPNIILSFVFYVFLFPISVLTKKKSKKQLKLRNNSDSTYLERNQYFNNKSFLNPW